MPRADPEGLRYAQRMRWQDGMLYVAGNGGSAADRIYIAGEFVMYFRFKRRLSESDRQGEAQERPT